MAKSMTTVEEYNAAIAGPGLVVVDFFATWCGPCRGIAPQIEVLAGENPDVSFIKVDVDNLSDVAESEKIEAMPTFKFFKGGVLKDTVMGANLEKIKAVLEKCKAE
eukprot:CAMPEP_0114556218 /NCGR_PEP_ID=MMETSP0114-20121206/9175_1 /TAXON_ID=31324 /ORGANISM="Goniomonas sp, Strain m" /LENGTH=105 /DNA_ID=CAMNT_0001741415 /DNA_START=24 /DNA_END=341 /DNA_ORIENTATION=+